MIWIAFRKLKTCPVCNGARLKKESLHFKVDGKNIFELAEMDIVSVKAWFENVEDRLNERQNTIAKEILKRNQVEIRLFKRCRFKLPYA